MLIVFTGHGKGKTTAALGQAVRSVGEGKKVLMVQFIKGPWKSGEDKAVKKMEPDLKIVKMGKGFVGILGDKLPRKEHKKAAEKALAFAEKEAKSGRWDMLILDEINNAVSLGLIPKKRVLDFLQPIHRSPKATGIPAEGQGTTYNLQAIILTGRDAPKEFIVKADLVTEMKDIKHPFHKGQKG